MPSDNWVAFAVIVNMVLFIIPGLIVAGLGRILQRRKAADTGRDGVAERNCPHCAEKIKAQARGLPVLRPRH